MVDRGLGQPVGLDQAAARACSGTSPGSRRSARRTAARGTGGGSGTRRRRSRGTSSRFERPATPGPAPPLGAEDRVAQRPRHALQHRGAGQERHLSGGRRASSSEHRYSATNRSSPVNPAAVPPPACLQGQRGQVQPPPASPPVCRPAPSCPGRTAAGPGRLQQRPRLQLIHRQLGDPDLDHLALGAQGGSGSGGRAGRRGQLRPAGKPDGQLVDRVQALLVLSNSRWSGPGRPGGSSR